MTTAELTLTPVNAIHAVLPANTPSTIEQQVEHAQTLLTFSGEITTANPKAVLSCTEHTKGEVIHIDPNQIEVMDGFNPRIRDAGFTAHIRSLADSIKEEGFYPSHPLAGIAGLKGKNPVIYLTDGHCRLEATKLAIAEGAPIKSVPMILTDRSTTMEDLTVMFARGNQGKRLTPLELAVVVKRLSKFNWSSRLIASKLGFSEEYVSQLLQIAGAPSSIRQMIADGEVPAAVAISAIKTHGAEASQVLTTAVATAKSNGRSGITKKNLPDQVFKRSLTKAAPDLLATVRQFSTHEAFEAFPADMRQAVLDLLMKFPQEASK